MLPSFLATWLLPLNVATAVLGFGIPPHQYHHQKRTTTTTVSSTPALGNSVANLTSTPSDALDGPKIAPINATVFDWWYFDAVDVADTKASIVITFFTSTDKGFALLTPQSNVTSVQIWASFPNGTLFSEKVFATEAVITTEGHGSSGDFKETGTSWEGTSDMKRYVVNVDSPSIGVKGTLTLNSVGPAHYPCGVPSAGNQNIQIFPHIGWSNAVPDAVAYADFTFLGTPFKFTGVGYHDKNWGDQPFLLNVQSWYWGHARLGPYSVVWFNGIGADGVERSSAYASLGPHLVSAKCQLSGLTTTSQQQQVVSVRPTGANSTYPPRQDTGHPEGFHIELDLGKSYGGVLKLDAKNELATVDAFGLYTRWVGSVTGTLGSGKKVLKGVSSQEQFSVVP